MQIHSEEIEILIKENQELKLENEVLSRQVCDSKSWTSIREGIIIPRLTKLSIKRHLISMITTPIGQIVKEYLDLRRLSEIDETNYDEAKSIVVELLDVLENHECSKSSRLNM
ncbi:hypothetical protein K5V21_03720 [Clostridium sardiniense]|uniref:Uncharacterized protein n=1 Tax=Clostridium sardiniense TaxID=29369 RepID=A0ABS7KUR5_CLOSR|nr:hypothetical protein [Clostridium sardiniense]MBY0754559.1 hypothetical protein [Clostridium sardiniense]MDQ0460840.1 hypothetical protein [Clostridium sardiniense]